MVQVKIYAFMGKLKIYMYLVSVIIPYFKKKIQKTINSVLNQTIRILK